MSEGWGFFCLPSHSEDVTDGQGEGDGIEKQTAECETHSFHPSSLLSSCTAHRRIAVWMFPIRTVRFFSFSPVLVTSDFTNIIVTVQGWCQNTSMCHKGEMQNHTPDSQCMSRQLKKHGGNKLLGGTNQKCGNAYMQELHCRCERSKQMAPMSVDRKGSNDQIRNMARRKEGNKKGISS